ncbi:MAG: 2-amino-4-hydroxy-6-hydroxymethyldihydropteridine diphosphokinase [Burkholderiales bacterium]|nr:2-amino-4-hydroxy-6-hydroxymethyldihydropteridine diphosphokinase [Burkholderiales bacterium]
MRDPVVAYIGLGSNLGDARRTVTEAIGRVAQLDGVRLLARSRLYMSAPVDAIGPDFINAVIAVETSLNAMDLLAALQQVELQAGRQRPYRNAPRTLDLDLLLYGSASIRAVGLSVPHPRMFERAFVLLPLREIAPERVTDAQLAGVADQAIAALPDR